MKNLIILLIGIFVSTAIFAKDYQGSLIKNGDQTPNFKLQTIDGKEFSITDLKGKVVLVNFFATWCGPCMKELPEVQSQLWPKFKDQDFVMVAIGREHTAAELKAFNQKKGFTFPLAADPKREVYSKFASQYIPRNYVLDKNGKIIFQSVGFNQKDLEKMMKVIADNL